MLNGGFPVLFCHAFFIMCDKRAMCDMCDMCDGCHAYHAFHASHAYFLCVKMRDKMRDRFSEQKKENPALLPGQAVFIKISSAANRWNRSG